MKKASLAVIFFIVLAFVSNLSTLSTQASGQAIILPNHTGYLDNTTIPITYHVVGEISNTGNISLKLLNVTASFHDQNNSIIGSSSSYALLNTLLPGRRTPFEVVLAAPLANQTYNYSLSLQFSEFAYEKPLALQIFENTTYVDEAHFQKVNGTIKNLAALNATAVKVVATFYDVNGNVTSVSYGYTTPSTIMPNQTEPFELEQGRTGLFFPNYTLTAESLEYALVPELSPLHIPAILVVFALAIIAPYRKRRDTRLN